jgi:hypothetical protein
VTDIENNRPAVIVLANAGGASSHTTVVTGYEYDARTTPAQYNIIMHDPWNIGQSDARIGKVSLASAASRFLAYYDFPGRSRDRPAPARARSHPGYGWRWHHGFR